MNDGLNAKTELADRGEALARLTALEEELAEILEQRRVDLARRMRGSERDNLRRQLDRQEMRLREKIEATRAFLAQAGT